jgi:ribosomal protein L11
MAYGEIDLVHLMKVDASVIEDSSSADLKLNLPQVVGTCSSHG